MELLPKLIFETYNQKNIYITVNFLSKTLSEMNPPLTYQRTLSIRPIAIELPNRTRKQRVPLKGPYIRISKTTAKIGTANTSRI